MTNNRTKLEQWAVELFRRAVEAYGGESIPGETECYAARVIQSAFEDRERKLREALWTPREAAWSGLARDLMLAFDMGCRTPREIFQHLDRCGKPIPQWLRDEGEMKHLDHVPSKGTRAVIIYRAMLEPAMEALKATPDAQ
ncbi:hypothetical protein SAMN05660666_02478 [Novosphingobium aromaticivorans]|nr:hypothetical protein [Novosphingobium aromaticivorans]SCY68832.1 hypothetical protein SAMN05660666_02478 [Novosphingobium aromaticivorans]